MPLPIGSYGAGPYGSGAYGYGAGPPPPAPPTPVGPGSLPFPHPLTDKELWVNAIVALGGPFVVAMGMDTQEELRQLFAQWLLNFQLSITLPYYTVGPGQGMVNDSGVTDNSTIVLEAFATALSLGYGGIHILPGIIPNGWYGMDVDAPPGMGVIGAGDGADTTNPGSTNPSPVYSGTVIGPVQGAKGVAPLRLSGAGSFCDNLICVGAGVGHIVGTFPVQNWVPTPGAAQSVGYGLLVNGHGARASRVTCIGGQVSACGFDAVATKILNATLIDVTCINPFVTTYTAAPDRSDTCTWSTSSPTITDTAISSADAYSPIVGFPGAAQAFVAPGNSLVPGASFVAIDPAGNVLTPTSGTGGTLSIKQFRGGGLYLSGTDVMMVNPRVYAGGTYIDGPDVYAAGPRFFPSGQANDVTVAGSGRVSLVAPTFDFQSLNPTSAMVRRGPAAIEVSAPTIEVTGTGPSIAVFTDRNPTAALPAFTIRGTTISGGGTITTLLDLVGGNPPGNIIEDTNVAAVLTNLYTNGTPAIVRSNLIANVFQPEIPSTTVSGVPIGGVLPFAGSSVPAGFLVCNGANVSRTTYATLFATIGTTFGSGDGATTFTLPNLSERYVKGADVAVPLGTYAGANTRSLTAANIPQLVANSGSGSSVHYHTIPGFEFVIGLTTAGGYWVNTPGGTPGTNTISFTPQTNTDGSTHVHSVTLGNASPTAVPTEPLNLALTYIIRAS